MIALCVLMFAATALAGISQPTPGLGVQARDGRQAHVRFISQLANPGANINLNGVASNTYTTQPAAVSIKVGTTTVVLTDTVNQGTTTAYAEIDTGNNGQATVTLTFNTPTPQTVTCPTVINKNDRVTYVLTQSVSPATPISSGSCSVGSGFCTNGAFTPGSATISCNAVTESLASVARTCPTVPVRFFNLHTGCPTLKYELSVTSGVSETLDLSKTIPTTFGTSSHEQLERSISRSIGGVPLISATTSSARFVDAFIDASGALTSVEKLETGFLNVVNLAYRENPVGTRDNNFVVVISQSGTIAGQLSKVVHFQTISAAQPLSQWIEVPTGSYFLHVYDDGDSETAIFGDNTGASIVAPTATALVIGSSTTIAANDVKIFRITNNAATAPLLAASLQVNTVTLNNNPSTLPNIADTTRHVIWNNVLQNSLKLAAPDSECCNYVKDFDDNEEVFANPGGSFDTNTLVPDVLTGSFSVFQSSSVCTALGSPIVSDTVALTDSTGSSECADQGIFVFARPVTVTSQTCTSTSTGVSTCSAGVSGTATSTVFASTTGVPSDTNPTGTIDLSLTVPFCDCTVPATPCGATLDCAEEAAFAALTAAVAASTTTITSAVSSSTTSIQTTVQAVNNTFITNIDDNNAGIDIALAAIASTNGTLHVQLGKVQATQAEHTSSLSTLSRKVVREFNGLEDDIEDLADEVDEVASAVDA